VSVVVIAVRPDPRYQEPNVRSADVVGAYEDEAAATEAIEERSTTCGTHNIEYHLIQAIKVVPVITVEDAE
jgi:hypothetical protein